MRFVDQGSKLITSQAGFATILNSLGMSLWFKEDFKIFACEQT